MALKVSRLAGALGAEIRGAQLSRRDDVAAVRKTLIDHLVVTLPDQTLLLDDLERLTDDLGGRAVTPFVQPLPDRPM